MDQDCSGVRGERSEEPINVAKMELCKRVILLMSEWKDSELGSDYCIRKDFFLNIAHSLDVLIVHRKSRIMYISVI